MLFQTSTNMGYDIVVLTYLFSQLCGYLGQEVIVTLQPQTVIEGDTATFECGFNINDSTSTFNFHNLAWLHNNLEFAYFNPSFDPVITNKHAVSNFTVFCNDAHSIFQLSEVRFAPDFGTYTCHVEFIDKLYTDVIRSNEAHAVLTVYVLPTVSSMSLSDDSGLLADGQLVIIQQGKLYNFSCEVHGTRPEATIKWYLGEVLILPPIESTTSEGKHELINTTSYWSTKPIEQYHDKELRCTASTPQLKDPPPSIQVKLHVKTMAPECVIKNITSTSAVVQCSPAYDSFDVRTYHFTFCKSDEPPINKTSKKGGTVEFVRENLEPLTFYAFEVFTNDSFGLSETAKNTFTTLLPPSPGDLGIIAYVYPNGVVSVKGIPESYRTSSSSFVRIERYVERQKEWVIFGDHLKEEIIDISFKEVQIRNCHGDKCSDASPALKGAAGSFSCLWWVIGLLTFFATTVFVE